MIWSWYPDDIRLTSGRFQADFGQTNELLHARLTDDASHQIVLFDWQSYIISVHLCAAPALAQVVENLPIQPHKADVVLEVLQQLRADRELIIIVDSVNQRRHHLYFLPCAEAAPVPYRGTRAAARR